MFWQLLITAAVCWAVYLRWQKRRIRKVCEEIPSGLPELPLIGHAYLMAGNHEDVMSLFQRAARIATDQGGVSSFWLVNKMYLNVTDPATADVILKSCLHKDNFTMKYMRTVIGNGSIFAPFNIWRPRRKILAPLFSLKNLNLFMEIFDKQSQIMARQLKPVVHEDFSIWKYVTTYTFDSVCETTMGIEMKSQFNSDHPFLKSFETLSQLVSERIYKPWLHPNVVYKYLPVYKDFLKHRGIIYDFINELIVKKRIELANNNNEIPDRTNGLIVNILDQYLKRFSLVGWIKDKAQEALLLDTVSFPLSEDLTTDGMRTFLEMMILESGGEKGYTNLELCEETMVLVMAGTDTSAVGACYTTVLLSRYQDIQANVYQELQEVFGDSDRPITVHDLPKLKYLDAVIKETLRMYPPVPVVVREVRNDVLLPNGTTLPDGVSIFMNIWGIHRNYHYWGKDVDVYRPERFLEGPLKHPVQFIPFSHASRNCLGYNYAIMSMKTAVANLLRSYRVLPTKALDEAQLNEPLRVKFDIMMKPVEDFVVRLEPRKM